MAFQNIKTKLVAEKESQGFTFIEIIAVLVVLGVISAVAMATMSMNENDLTAQTDALTSYIKYAQSKSMGTTSRVFGIGIDATNDTYWIFACASSGACTCQDTKIILPGGNLNPAYEDVSGDQINTSQADVNITGSSLAIIFDKLGRPFLRNSITGSTTYVEPLADTTGLSLQSNNVTITLTDDNSHTRTITIIPETGFIQ